MDRTAAWREGNDQEFNHWPTETQRTEPKTVEVCECKRALQIRGIDFADVSVLLPTHHTAHELTYCWLESWKVVQKSSQAGLHAGLLWDTGCVAPMHLSEYTQ